MRLLFTICVVAALLAITTVTASPPGESDRPAPPDWGLLDPDALELRSKAALIVDHDGNEVFSRQPDTPLPIASLTKLMTTMVILDAQLPLDETVTITRDDRDLIRLTGSRLHYGATLPRGQLLRLMLMASENRAAAALARTFPGGTQAFIAAMNAKADELGMVGAAFADPAGLDAGNVASARDLVTLARAASGYPLIREATTDRAMQVWPYPDKGPLRYVNTNRLLRNRNWEIALSKTGYINESGRCLLMQTELGGIPVTVVLLNSYGKLTPFGDSNRLRKWVDRGLDARTADRGEPTAGPG